MIKGPIHQEYITILNAYVYNNKASYVYTYTIQILNLLYLINKEFLWRLDGSLKIKAILILCVFLYNLRYNLYYF